VPRSRSEIITSLVFVLALAASCTDRGDTHRDVGRAYARRGEHARAVREFRRALSAHPDDAVVLTLLGNSEFELGRLGDADRHFRQALSEDPDLSDAHFGLGMLLARQGKRREAAGALEHVLETNPMDLTVLLNLGRLYIAERDLVRGRQRLESALRIDDDNVDAEFNLGLLAIQERKLEEATDRFRRVDALAPREPYGTYGLAAVAANRGEKTEALRLLGKAIDVGIEDKDAIARDVAFAPLARDPDFLALLRR
jgi:Flp pilus assembly protein TadD